MPCTRTPRRLSGNATRPVPIPNSSAAPPAASSARKLTVGSRTPGSNMSLDVAVVVPRDALRRTGSSSARRNSGMIRRATNSDFRAGPRRWRIPPLRPPLRCVPVLGDVDRLADDLVVTKLVDADTEGLRTPVVRHRVLDHPESSCLALGGCRRTSTLDSCSSSGGSSRRRRTARRIAGTRARRRRRTSRGRARGGSVSTRSSAGASRWRSPHPYRSSRHSG